ncbi:hypothetical protein H311_03673 [Anncaliia algerae PRA109]|nr:hypothetical protein H311_03673 [Anncaliia algerae PRA109]
MLQKITRIAFLLEHLSQQTFIQPSTFNNIYTRNLNIKIKKLKSKLKKSLHLFESQKKEITIKKYNKILARVVKYNFTLHTNKIKGKTKNELKSLFSKNEKFGRRIYFNDLLVKYNINNKRMKKDWNFVHFLIELEEYLYNFIRKGGHFKSLTLKDTKEHGNIIYSKESDCNNFDEHRTIVHPQLLNINAKLITEFNLSTIYCLGCKKEFLPKMIKYHLKNKIHQKYDFTIIFPDEEYFNYLLNIYLLTIKKEKNNSNYYFHCELCCSDKCEKLQCDVEIKDREKHFLGEHHLNNLRALGIDEKKGNYIFNKERALVFLKKENEEEIEDDDGNLYDLKTYWDLKGLNLL